MCRRPRRGRTVLDAFLFRSLLKHETSFRRGGARRGAAAHDLNSAEYKCAGLPFPGCFLLGPLSRCSDPNGAMGLGKEEWETSPRCWAGWRGAPPRPPLCSQSRQYIERSGYFHGDLQQGLAPANRSTKTVEEGVSGIAWSYLFRVREASAAQRAGIATAVGWTVG